jgi:hypothetical protein
VKGDGKPLREQWARSVEKPSRRATRQGTPIGISQRALSTYSRSISQVIKELETDRTIAVLIPSTGGNTCSVRDGRRGFALPCSNMAVHKSW